VKIAASSSNRSYAVLEAPLLEISEFKQLAAAISIPIDHKFARVYFGFRAFWDGGGFVVE
jgi:hypothetical protein